MPKKKDFWELADSTILGRTQKKELLQIARSEHQQIQAYRAQLDTQAQQVESQNQLIDELKNQLEREKDQLGREGEVHRQVLTDLFQTFKEQQHNHEQELTRLQTEAKDWESIAQNYEAVIVTQRSEISYLQSVTQRIRQFGQMSPLEAGQAFVQWLFGSKSEELVEHCTNCNGVITYQDYRFCPHCGRERSASLIR